MSILRLLNDTVTVHRRGASTTDAEGNPTPTYTTADYKARVEPRDVAENVEGQLTATTQLVAFLPSTATVDAHDHIVYDGNRYEIVGPPLMRRTPRGDHHQEVRLRIVEL